MNGLFYFSAAVAIVATFLTITRVYAVHALLYLIVSLLAVALTFYSLGAPFVAALEAIIYAGAIMVLFVFVVMMLNLSPEASREETAWWTPGMWVGPAILAALLLVELIYVLVWGGGAPTAGVMIDPKQVGIALFGPYLLGVELASMLLLAGLVGAYYLGHRSGGQRIGGE
ncbi:MAG TPA: NADH-quinone oxidoreductase subunit J [Chloroflexota bacterium]|nr:NADH-quinone oxidoreductase subunit J [Chloroflexota bacterium]